MILPDVRGLHPYYEELALRFAEHGIDALAIDWFGRTAGAEPRGDDFDYMPARRARRPGPGSRPTSSPAVEAIGATATATGPRRARVFTIGFCMGGRMSFLAATLGLGPGRRHRLLRDAGRAVAQRRAGAGSTSPSRFAAPVLGLFGGADTGISAEAVAAFDAALAAGGVDHRLVTYPGAPHSFFDRKAAEFADASAAAWAEILAFIAAHTG